MTSDTAPVSPRRVHAGRADDVGRALVQAAHRVLSEEGPFALTVRRVAQVAGVSTMNVYSRFGGKDGLIDELFIDGFTRLGERMKTRQLSDDPFADLQGCAVEYRRWALENPTYYTVMFDTVVPEWTPSPVAAQTAMTGLEGLASQVQRAIDAGQLEATDAMSLAISFWATWHGLISLEMREAGRYEFDWPAVYEETCKRLQEGFRHPPRAGGYGRLDD